MDLAPAEMANKSRTSSPDPEIDPQETSSPQIDPSLIEIANQSGISLSEPEYDQLDTSNSQLIDPDSDVDSHTASRQQISPKEPVGQRGNSDSAVPPKPLSTQSEITSFYRDDTVPTNTSQQHSYATGASVIIAPDLLPLQESNAHQLVALNPQHVNTTSESIAQDAIPGVNPTSGTPNPNLPLPIALPEISEVPSPNLQSILGELLPKRADVSETSRRLATESLSDDFKTLSTKSCAFDSSEVKILIETIASSAKLSADFAKQIAQSPEFVPHLDLKQLTKTMFSNPDSSRLVEDMIRDRFMMLNPKISEKKRESRSTNTTQVANPKLKVGIEVLPQEMFKANTLSVRKNPRRPGHSIESPPARTLFVIEVVLKASRALDSQVQRIRHIDHTTSSAATRDVPLQDVPDRIRIRSAFLLNLLHRVTNDRLDHGGDKTSDNSPPSLVFLYPFKFFIIHADKIEAEANRLEAKFGNGGHSGQSNASTGSDGPPTNDGPTMSSEDAATDIATNLEDEFESKKACEYLKLISNLVARYLKPIIELRKRYQNGTHKTISYQDLWLLYEVGGLVFQREPLPSYPATISRVTHFDGGRELLNNGEFKGAEPRKDIPGPNSKGTENRFYLRHYRLDFDGEYYGPVEEAFSIPPWEGIRSVYDLKAFPLQFCRNGIDHKFESLEDFRNHVIKRGKKFVELDPINHKHYRGQVIGSRHEFYNSPVVVDLKLRKGDKDSRHGLLNLMELVSRSDSNLSAGLTIYPGDPREVQEGSPRSNTSAECIYPGCDGNEFIHDDIRLDKIFARQKIESYGITSAKFSRSDVAHLVELDYALFPTFVHGYVLNDRVWAKLDLDLLTTISNADSMFDALHIPAPHKENLTALVDMCKSPLSSHLALDIVPGKGQGIIILLHGKPGLGKTATAEAMAADLSRPLYPITYADLGDGPSEIETNLKKIFRYGKRWNCVLLLDEADVFLMPRNIEDTRRNSIVSIFLRNLEWYPGIIFLTTNRLDRFDDGVLDRVDLKLRYPELSEVFTERIFDDHFKRINRLRQLAEDLPPGEHREPTSYCQVKENDMKMIQVWRADQYAIARKAGTHWWNGREIRNAFKLAAGFARQEMLKNEKEVASIKLRHFEQALKLNATFEDDLINAVNEDHDKAD